MLFDVSPHGILLVSAMVAIGFQDVDASSADIQTILSQAQNAVQEGEQEALKMLQDIPLPHSRSKEACGSCQNTWFSSGSPALDLKRKDSVTTELMIFVSSSMPEESLKALSQQAQRVGGTLVFRGLIGGSFQKTQAYFERLQIVGDIDPTRFDDDHVTHVPTFILKDAAQQDRIMGNISVEEVLIQIKTKGTLKTQAQSLLRRLKGEKP